MENIHDDDNKKWHWETTNDRKAYYYSSNNFLILYFLPTVKLKRTEARPCGFNGFISNSTVYRKLIL